MRGLRYLEPKGPWNVAEFDDPIAGNGEVVVDMAFAGLNPIDALLWQGVGGLRPPTMPHVPGVEGAGWLNGKPVMVFGHGLGVQRWGAAAERAVVAGAAIFPVPAGLDLASAAVCGATGATAMRLFELSAARAGDCVLVYAAGGNVGSMLGSLLAAAGVQVLGQVRDPSKAKVVMRAGGQPVIAREPAEVSAALRGSIPTVVADPLGGAWTNAAIETIAAGGLILSFGALAEPVALDTLRFYRKGLTLRGYSGLQEPEAHARCIGLAMQAAAEGRMLIAPLLRAFPLARAVEAFEALRASEPGKIVIELRPG
jgi:NADPH:quinone reductase